MAQTLMSMMPYIIAGVFLLVIILVLVIRHRSIDPNPKVTAVAYQIKSDVDRYQRDQLQQRQRQEAIERRERLQNPITGPGKRKHDFAYGFSYRLVNKAEPDEKGQLEVVLEVFYRLVSGVDMPMYRVTCVIVPPHEVKITYINLVPEDLALKRPAYAKELDKFNQKMTIARLQWHFTAFVKKVVCGK